MERHDIIVGHFFVLFVEGLDEVDVFRDRRNDDDIRSDKILFMKSFAEKLRIKLQRLFDEIFCKRILLDEIVGLIPILDDSVVFVHLFERAHSQVQGFDAMVKSVLDLDRLAEVFGDIEENKIIFFEIVSEEQQGVKRLRQDAEIVLVKKIAVDGVDDVHRFLIEIDDIQSEKYLAGLSDDVLLLFAVDMNIVDIDHDPFPIDIVVFFGRFTFLFYDIFEILERELLVECLENIESEEAEPAFIQHEIMGIFWVLSWIIRDLDEVLV